MKLLVVIGVIAFCNTPVQGEDEAQSRIYNGNYAEEGQFPYMAYLVYDIDELECGASIIHKRWLLTAGHCYLDFKSNPRVTVGTTKLYYTNESDGDTYKVQKFLVHENYKVIPEENNNGLEYVAGDIGLIRVDRDIQFNNKVQPIKLARDSEPNYNGNQVVISGWGKTARGFMFSVFSPKLRYIEVAIKDHDECRKTWTYITEKYVCTDNSKGGVCYADSGSPVVLNGVQVGLASTADTYCQSLKPDLHTRVSSYIPWIEDKLSLYGESLQ